MLIFDFLYFVLCSLMNFQNQKQMFIKMPGRKHLGSGRLKEIAFQIRFWQFLFQSPLRQCFCILHNERESKKIRQLLSPLQNSLSQNRLAKSMENGEEKCSYYGRMCSLLGRELTRKLICGLQTIAHSNQIQEKRMSKRQCVQEHINI